MHFEFILFNELAFRNQSNPPTNPPRFTCRALWAEQRNQKRARALRGEKLLTCRATERTASPPRGRLSVAAVAQGADAAERPERRTNRSARRGFFSPGDESTGAGLERIDRSGQRPGCGGDGASWPRARFSGGAGERPRRGATAPGFFQRGFRGRGRRPRAGSYVPLFPASLFRTGQIEWPRWAPG